MASGALIGTISGHASFVWTARYDEGNNFIATASDDDSIGVWDTARLRALGFLIGHSRPAYRAYFASGFRLVSAGWDGTVNIWQLRAESRTPAELKALLRCRVPFQLDAEGTLRISRPNSTACSHP